MDSDDMTAEWLEKATSHLSNEVMVLRFGLRFWLAIHYANTSRWFGGSDDLHYYSENAFLTEFLMRLRRVTDKPKYKKTAKNTDFTLLNVLTHMRDGAQSDRTRGHLDEGLKKAEALRKSPDIGHLRQMADKMIAHANPVGLQEAGPRVPDLDVDQYTVELMARAVERVSAVFHRYVAPDLAYTDARYQHGDVFHRLVKDRGLPVLDYPLAEVFLGSGDADRERQYVTVQREAWDSMVALLPKPLPPSILDVDARVMWKEMPQDEQDAEALVERWGLTLEEVHRVLFEGAASVFPPEKPE